MKNAREGAADGVCPLCAGKQKVVRLPDFLEWSEKHEAWAPLTVSICDKCGRTTIHTFNPDMFASLPTSDRNEKLAGGCKLTSNRSEDVLRASRAR